MPHFFEFVPHPKAPRRARNNMAKFTQAVVFDGIPFIDSDDLVAYKRSLGLAPAGAAPVAAQPLAVPAGYRTSRQSQPGDIPLTPERMAEWNIDAGVLETAARGRGRGGGKAKRPAPTIDSLSIDVLARVVGKALGGMNRYCPGIIPVLSKLEEREMDEYEGMKTMALLTLIESGDALARKALDRRVSHKTALERMGLTEIAIQEIAKAFRLANLLLPHYFPTDDGQTGETLVVAKLIRGSDGQFMLASSGSTKATQEDHNLIKDARKIAEKFGLRCPVKTNPTRYPKYMYPPRGQR